MRRAPVVGVYHFPAATDFTSLPCPSQHATHLSIEMASHLCQSAFQRAIHVLARQDSDWHVPARPQRIIMDVLQRRRPSACDIMRALSFGGRRDNTHEWHTHGSSGARVHPIAGCRSRCLAREIHPSSQRANPTGRPLCELKVRLAQYAYLVVAVSGCPIFLTVDSSWSTQAEMLPVLLSTDAPQPRRVLAYRGQPAFPARQPTHGFHGQHSLPAQCRPSTHETDWSRGYGGPEDRGRRRTGQQREK